MEAEYRGLSEAALQTIPLARLLWSLRNYEPYYDDPPNMERIMAKVPESGKTKSILLSDLDYSRLRMKILEDNQSCIKAMKNGKYKRGRLNHLPLRIHWVKNLNGQICDIEYIRSEEQRADIFTKVLGRNDFFRARNQIGMLDIRTLQGEC